MGRRILLLAITVSFVLNGRTFAGQFPHVDLALVMDISTMGQEEFDIYINSVKSFLNARQVDGSDDRIALMYYSSQPHVLTHLSDGIALDTALTGLDTIPATSEERNTDLALAAVSSDIFTLESGDRDGIDNVVFLLTTGSSSNPLQTLTEANRIKHANMSLFVVGIGQWASDVEIQFMSSKPASLYSKRIASISYLNGTLEEMLRKEHTFGDNPKILECAPLFDVAFIIDVSNSLSPEDFQREKQFVNQVVSSFDISPKTTRAALIAFNADSRIVFNLETYRSYTPMSTAIMAVSQTGPGRDLDKAIRFARNAIFKKLRYDDGFIPVPQILIIVTGGKTRFVKKTIREARLLKESGVTIFAIGVGRRQRYDVSRIASNPVTRFNFNIQRFKFLDKVFRDMIGTMCRELGGVTQVSLAENFEYGVPLPHEECQGESDVLFLFQLPHEEENLKAVCSYMKTVMKYLNIGPDTIRVGLVSYQTGFISALPLEQNADKKTIMATIDKISKDRASYHVTDSDSTEFAHIAHWREDVVKILIFVYADNPNAGRNSRVDEFKNSSHRQDVLRFVINVGKPYPELANALASEPKTSHIFFAPFLNNLINSVPYLVDRICDESAPTNRLIVW